MSQQNPAAVSQKIHRYPCPACGADLLYDPRDGFLSCLHCGNKEAIPTSAERVEERSFEQYLQMRPQQLQPLAAGALEVQCQSCGATVAFTPPEVARQCDFCGVQIVAQAKSADPTLAPEGILPFRITQQQASVALREWLRSRWFAPSALKTLAHTDAISGVYLPFWTYDTHTPPVITLGNAATIITPRKPITSLTGKGIRSHAPDRCGTLAGLPPPAR